MLSLEAKGSSQNKVFTKYTDALRIVDATRTHDQRKIRPSTE
jgi:hypothetical protein